MVGKEYAISLGKAARGCREGYGGYRSPPAAMLSMKECEKEGERGYVMYVNCYDTYGLCLFAVRVKEGVEPVALADHIYYEHELVDTWHVTEEPEGAVVRY